MKTALVAAGLATTFIDEDGNQQLYTNDGVEIDIIGKIYSETGNMLIDAETGTEYPETVAVTGYHFNIRTVTPLTSQQLSKFTVCTPSTPTRTWM